MHRESVKQHLGKYLRNHTDISPSSCLNKNTQLLRISIGQSIMSYTDKVELITHFKYATLHQDRKKWFSWPKRSDIPEVQPQQNIKLEKENT